MDLCKDEKFIDKAKTSLIDAGAERIFKVSSLKKEGIEELKKWLVKE